MIHVNKYDSGDNYMKIIDTTTFFEENLMMGLRFEILDQFVDKFVICEARYTHSGKRKNINFDKKNFPKFENKIIHLIVEDEPKELIKKEKLNNLELRANSVLRIKEQRNYISKVLNDFSKDDLVIHSDNDEIPDLENFDLKKTTRKFIIFKQKMFYYKFNLILPGLDWFGSKVCRIGDLKNIDNLRSIKNKKYPFYRFDTVFSDIKHQNVQIVENGGWHFSNLKNIEELERKYLNDENHSEYESFVGHSLERIRENIKNRVIDYNHLAKKNSLDRFKPTKLQKVEINILPKAILTNLDKYREWLD